MVFGATAHTDLKGIVAVITAGKAITPLLIAGAGLLLVGLGFKVAAVPFHMWTPDVYQGAPSPVSGFMSVATKAAGFAALLRIFSLAFPSLMGTLTPVIWGLAALTMLVGNVLAISQGNIKRLQPVLSDGLWVCQFWRLGRGSGP
jgi:NADH-quinone oxidoreductase subunit N